ncbi:unnamed protein product, partial [Vitis vinifera]
MKSLWGKIKFLNSISLKLSTLKCPIFAKISENFSNFEHFERSRISRDVKDPMLLGSSFIPVPHKPSSLKNFISRNVLIDE